jgi:hypothetical protein
VKCSAIAPVWKWVGWSGSGSPAIWAIILGISIVWRAIGLLEGRHLTLAEFVICLGIALAILAIVVL